MRTERLLSALCLLALATAGAAAAAPQDIPTDPPRLFASEAAAGIPDDRRLVPDSAEEFFVDLDPSTVAANPRILAIDLPGHPPLEAVRRRFVEYRTDWKSWFGTLRPAGSKGRGTGFIHIGYHGDRLTALIRYSAERYRIVGGRGESHRLARLSDELATKSCGVEDPADPAEALFEGLLDGESEIVSQTAALATHRLDLLVLYPTNFFTTQDGESAVTGLEDFVHDSVALANDVFENSGVDAEYNLVGIAPLTGPQPPTTGVLAALSWLSATTMPPEAASLRQAYGADLLALYVPFAWSNPNACGIANLPLKGGGFRGGSGAFNQKAFTAHRVDCGLDDYTLAHEIGHTYGMHHDDDRSDSDPLIPNSYGHVLTVAGEQKATVMGCTCGAENNPDGKPVCPTNNGGIICNRIYHFSDPGILYQNVVPTGTPTRNNANVARLQTPGYAGFFAPSPNTPPTAAITASCTGRVCSFSATSSTDNVALPTNGANYYWDFGDGTTGTGRTTPKTYASGGTYRVHLVVTDSGGQRDVADRLVSPWNPLYEGTLEPVNCRTITGWAWDQRDPNGQVRVELLKDGSRVTTLTANFFRQDLVNAGKGNGIHGFVYNPGSIWDDGVWHQVGARTEGPPVTTLSGSPQPIICKVPFFASGTPASFLDTGARSWSVGNVFSSRIAGYVTHLRYYKAAEESGIHTLQLWTESGQPLDEVSVDFGSPGTAGWKTGKLAGNGVPVAAGARFVVTVTTSVKQSKTDCQFSSPITRDPLTAHGGRWEEGVDIFPRNSSCSNFWTDVYFEQ